MSGVSMPVTRPSGRALLVAGPASRSDTSAALAQLGFEHVGIDDPYAAMAELCRRPLAYRALIVSLAGVYKEELALIPAVKRRFPHIDVWVTHTDGRQAALAESMRLGADGLLAEDGLHRVALAPPAASPFAAASGTTTYPLPPPSGETVTTLAGQPAPEPVREEAKTSPDVSTRVETDDVPSGEPVLTADELRALLHEQPSAPPVGGAEE